MLEFALLLAIVFVLAYPLGKYLAAIMHNREMKIDPLFNWIEKPIYAVFWNQSQTGDECQNLFIKFCHELCGDWFSDLGFIHGSSQPAAESKSCAEYVMGFGAAYHDFVSDQYQSAALFRTGTTVLFIANGWHCRLADHHADDGPGDGGGYSSSTVLQTIQCTF